MNYIFHPEAENDFLDAVAYYESKQKGLGRAFIESFDQVMLSVCHKPNLCPIKFPPDIRRKSLERFPYAIIFKERVSQIEVLAVAHHRRRPSYWYGRKK